MENAKKELQDFLKGQSPIKCAIVWKDRYYDKDEIEKSKFKLPVNHNEEELLAFYNSLDFEYDDGYGGQQLFGTVWLKDGTWLSRGEYDGSEWWKHNVLPEIPAELF